LRRFILQRTLIIYESKHGTTEKMVKYLSLIMGPAKVCKVEEFTDAYRNFDLYVIGSPIYETKLDAKILKFVENNIDWLKEKNIVLFCNCIIGSDGEFYLQPLKELFGEKVIFSRAIRGELISGSLNKIEHEVKESQFDLLSSFSMEELVNFSLNLKEAISKLKRKAPEDTIKKFLEVFLHSHSTCTLCTGIDGKVRGTPVEYFYKDGYIYMLTEGGEKFANILLNPNVSICIYSSFTNIDKLNVLQINGVASLVDMNSREYNEIMRRRGIKSERLMVFPAYLNLLKIKLGKAEYLYHKFNEMGYDGRQVYIFKGSEIK
jgi:flavodoxin